MKIKTLVLVLALASGSGCANGGFGNDSLGSVGEMGTLGWIGVGLVTLWAANEINSN